MLPASWDRFVVYLNGSPLTTTGGEPLQVNPIKTIGAKVPLGCHDVASSTSLLQQSQNVLATQGMNFGVVDKDFFFAATFAAADIVDDVAQVFVVPTPIIDGQVFRRMVHSSNA